MMEKSFRLSFFDWFLIAGVVTASLVLSLLDGHVDWLDFAGVVTGIVNLVLCARGDISNYIFGIIYNAIYAYIAFSSSLYADAVVYAAYYLPMQFIGWASWRRNRNADDGMVQAGHLTLKTGIALLAAAAVLVPLFAWILGLPAIADAQPWTDSATTVASILAMYMMVKAIAEQWYIWLALNVLQVIKWSVAVSDGTPHAGMWLIMFAFYTANSVCGIIQWNKLADRG